MTAVPAQRKKAKDPFQMELDKEIARRKSSGLATGFSEDDYEDDFDEDDVTGTYGNNTYSKQKMSKPKSKWNVPSYLLSDDEDDDMILDGSKFVKKSAKSTAPLPTKNFSKEASQKSPRSIKKQKPIDEQSFENNPLLSLLSGTTSTQSSHKIQSSLDDIPRSTSPHLSYTMKPRAKTPIQTSLQEDEHESVYPSLTPKPRTRNKDKPLNKADNKELSALNNGRAGDGKKSSSSILDDILLPAQRSSHDSHGDTLSLSKSHEKNDSQSIIDMLLASNSSEPVPKPRKKDADPRVKDRSRSRSHSGSRPGSAKSRNRSMTPPARESLKSRQFSKQKETEDSLLGQLPSLTGIRKSQTFAKDETSLDLKQLSHQRTKSKEKNDLEKAAVQKQSTADDLLALFDQATVETIPHSQETVTMQSKDGVEQKSPVEEVIEKTNKETRASTPKQRSSKQLYDNIIENVASHNQENHLTEERQIVEIKSDSTTSLEETHIKKLSGKPKSSMKSPRRPPATYQGLGSLTAHKQLKLKQDSSENLNTSEDIRKSIYMNWLAEREKQRKIQKKAELKKIEEENEKKKKELEDKFFENEGARNAWMQQKEEQIKEKEKRKKREEKKAREQKLHKEEEKWKSQKKCDVLRQKALEDAKVKHREELKKKRQDEQLKKEKEKHRQEESKKAMNEWLEKRSKQWEEDRKKEAKERRKNEKDTNKSKKEKEEEGLRKYQSWRERKDNELIRSRSSIHEQVDDDRPVWSPANKIIPRGR